jgi:hypothetical protein
MYLLSQLVSYLFLAFLLGVGVGYALWRTWGEREAVAKFNAAEMRLASHFARWEQSLKQQAAGGRETAAMLRETEEAAIRKAEAAAEKKFADLTKTLGYDMKSSHGVRGQDAQHSRESQVVQLVEPSPVRSANE